MLVEGADEGSAEGYLCWLFEGEELGVTLGRADGVPDGDDEGCA